jgi:hypothetical protein
LIEATINAKSARDALTYFAPVIAGVLIAAIGVAIEISPPETPWTIHPILPDCGRGSDIASPQLAALKSYNNEGSIKGNEFWLQDKCWPNVFVYLTEPVLRKTVDTICYKERI